MRVETTTPRRIMPGNPTVTWSNCGICPAISCSTPTKRSGGKAWRLDPHPRREQFALGVEHRPLIPEPPQSRLSVRMGYRLPGSTGTAPVRGPIRPRGRWRACCGAGIRQALTIWQEL